MGEEISELLREGHLGPLEGFRSKRGMPFGASLRMEGGKAKFVFNTASEVQIVDIKDSPIIGSSPVDGTSVYQTLSVYISQSAVEKKDTGLQINRMILGKEIDLENMKRLLAKEKTNLIKGFRSTKTRRQFDAYLELDGKGKIKFSFPTKKRVMNKKS